MVKSARRIVGVFFKASRAAGDWRAAEALPMQGTASHEKVEVTQPETVEGLERLMPAEVRHLRALTEKGS